MTEYPLFWPSTKVGTTYPLSGDAADAGGGGIGANATGELPIGDTSSIETGGTVFIGGPNVVWGPQSDIGDRSPSDTDFTPQQVILANVFANVVGQDNPGLDLDVNYVDPFPAMERTRGRTGRGVRDRHSRDEVHRLS